MQDSEFTLITEPFKSQRGSIVRGSKWRNHAARNLLATTPFPFRSSGVPTVTDSFNHEMDEPCLLRNDEELHFCKSLEIQMGAQFELRDLGLQNSIVLTVKEYRAQKLFKTFEFSASYSDSMKVLMVGLLSFSMFEGSCLKSKLRLL